MQVCNKWFNVQLCDALKAFFSCSVQNCLGIAWTINDVAAVIHGGVNTLESVGNSILSSNLSIIASPELNNSNISCLAVIAGDTLFSTVLLLVQG